MKIALIYTSMTGNTQAMAEAIAEGAQAAGAEVLSIEAGDPRAATVLDSDIIVLGSPAMGDEELESSEMEPLFSEMEENLTGKKIALFGSYDWGDGQWMRDWEERVTAAGGTLVQPGLICHLEPEDESLEACVAFGKALAEA